MAGKSPFCSKIQIEHTNKTAHIFLVESQNIPHIITQTSQTARPNHTLHHTALSEAICSTTFPSSTSVAAASEPFPRPPDASSLAVLKRRFDEQTPTHRTCTVIEKIRHCLFAACLRCLVEQGIFCATLVEEARATAQCVEPTTCAWPRSATRRMKYAF